MTRGHLRHFQTDSAGNAVIGASVAVKDSGGNSLTLYASSTGGTTVANPIITTTAGLAECWIATPQTVTLTITDASNTAVAGGVTLASFTHTVTVEVFPAPEDIASGAALPMGTAPGGELGGTWATPTVDSSHSGSTHAAVQAAAEATAVAADAAHLAANTGTAGKLHFNVSEAKPQLHVSTTGSDSTGDGRIDRPYATVEAAVTALGASGGKVVLGPGNFQMLATMAYVQSNLAVQGMGETITKIIPPVGQIGFDLGDDVTQYHYITLRDLTISRSDSGGANVLRARKIDQLRLDHVTLAGGNVNAALTSIVTGSFVKVQLSSATSIGAQLSACDQVTWDAPMAESNVGALYHFEIDSSNKNIVFNGPNLSTADTAFYIHGASNEIAIVGGAVENCKNGIIHDGTGTRIVIAGLVLRGTGVAGGYGMQLKATDSEIAGVVVTNYVNSIVEVTGADRNSINARVDVAPVRVGANSVIAYRLGDGVWRMDAPSGLLVPAGIGGKYKAGTTLADADFGATAPPNGMIGATYG